MVNLWMQASMSLVVGLLTASGAWLGVRHSVRGNDRATEQRELAARREEWMRRFMWAAELAQHESTDKRVTGLRLLEALAESELAQRDECLLLDVFQKRVLDELLHDFEESGEGQSEA
jgi:hypothetical protein